MYEFNSLINIGPVVPHLPANDNVVKNEPKTFRGKKGRNRRNLT